MIKDSILIRLHIILLCLITSFMFSSCGLLALFTVDDRMDSVECMSPEELTLFMNKQFPEANFKLIGTDFSKDKHNYKERIVYLTAANFPGKTITAIQSYHSSRMTVVRSDFYFYTDYFFYKNEEQIYAAFKKLYSPLTNGLEENEWKLVLKPDVYTFSFYTTDEYSKIVKDNYLNVTKIIQSTRYDSYLLINKDFSADVQRDYNAFMYDLQKTYEEEGWSQYIYDDWSYDYIRADDSAKERTTPYADLHCYYSTSVSAATVTNKELTSTDFGSKQGITVPETPDSLITSDED